MTSSQLVALMMLVGASCISAGMLESAYPEAKITVKVVDESGRPVSDADVGIGFALGGNAWIGEGKSENIRGLSDTNGLFSAQAKCAGSIGIGVDKEGYYRSFGDYNYPGTYQKKDRWEPWNPTNQVVLKAIKNPIPMYVKSVRTVIPEINKTIGFDLEKGDWVAPYGKGSHTDLNVEFSGFFAEVRNRESRLSVSFPSQGDGIQEYLEEPVSWMSLRLPYEAPEKGYQSEWHDYQIVRPNGFRKNLSLRENANFIFRVRTDLDRHGHVVKASYGKIYGDIEFGFTSPEQAQLIFTYYFNPTPNDRNLEFDPDKNLFGNRDRFAP